MSSLTFCQAHQVHAFQRATWLKMISPYILQLVVNSNVVYDKRPFFQAFLFIFFLFFYHQNPVPTLLHFPSSFLSVSSMTFPIASRLVPFGTQKFFNRQYPTAILTFPQNVGDEGRAESNTRIKRRTRS